MGARQPLLRAPFGLSFRGDGDSPFAEDALQLLELIFRDDQGVGSDSLLKEVSGAGMLHQSVRDGGGTVTSATADFQVTLTGFPGSSTLTMAHIHRGGAGVGDVLRDPRRIADRPKLP